MEDFYHILGLERGASADEIKLAYRRLANRWHPDKSGGNEEKFKEIQRAYETLGDPARRAEYDNPQVRLNSGRAGFHPNFNFDPIFDIFSGRPNSARRTNIIRLSIWITLRDAALGGRRPINIGTPNGNNLVEIEIPQGIDEGETVQYHGLAPGGGDLIITFRLHRDPRWQRQGLNLFTEHLVDIWDLILGSKIILRDILNNELELTIPERTQPGTVLRCRARGLKSRDNQVGDLMVQLQSRIPNQISPELLEMIKKENESKTAQNP